MKKDTLFAIGEALIDFIPAESGCDFSDVTAFSPKVGGAPANVLGAFARLGGRTQLLTQLGEDPFGHKIAGELSAFGIGTDNVVFTDRANTALAFVSLGRDGDRTFSFYRKPSADMLYTEEMVATVDFSRAYALHFCSVSLGDFPMKAAHRRAIAAARAAGAIISFDPNLRFPLWSDPEALRAAVRDFLPAADLLKVSEEEVPFITGCDDPARGCERLLATSPLVLCTCGASGAWAYTRRGGVFVPAAPVVAKDTTGAGDAFCGSFLWQLYRAGYTVSTLGDISREELETFLTRSNAYCGKSVQHPGAIASYPTQL